MNTANRDAAKLLQGLGVIYLRTGQAQRALGLLLLAVRIQPKDVALLRQLALAFTASGDGERAVATLDRLLMLEGESTGLLLLRSRALLRAGRGGEARQLFRRYLSQRLGGRQ